MPDHCQDSEGTRTALARIHSLKEEARTSQATSDELGDLQSEVKGLQGDRRTLRREVQRMEDELRGIRVELKDREAERAKVEGTTQGLRKKVRALEKEKAELLARQREMEDSRTLAARLEADIEEMEADKIRFNQTLKDTRQELGEVREEKAILQNQLLQRGGSSPDGEVSEDYREIAAASPEEAEELAQLRSDRRRYSSLLKRLLDVLHRAREQRDSAIEALARAAPPPGNGEEAPPAQPGGERLEPVEDLPIVGDDLAAEEEKLRELLDGMKGSEGGEPSPRTGPTRHASSGVSAQTEEIKVPSDLESSPWEEEAVPRVGERREADPAGRHLSYLFDPDDAPERIQVATVRQVVRSYLSFLKRSPGEALRFPSVGNSETYLRMHSHNVSKLAMYLGLHLGMEDAQVETLGLCGLLHDIGMAEIPESIVSKKEPLTETEMRWIREHPTIGSRLLETLHGLERDVPRVVRQHHERIDGSGYPEGRKAERIHRFAKILNLVDGYEAMSAPRVYRGELLPNESMRILARPLIIAQAVDLPGSLSEEDLVRPSPSRAMEQVVLQTPQVYDPALVRAFLLAMGYYPTGSYIRLTSGEIARVVGANGEEVRKPIVKVVLDADGHVPRESLLIDILRDESRQVSHAVSGVPYEDLP